MRLNSEYSKNILNLTQIYLALTKRNNVVSWEWRYIWKLHLTLHVFKFRKSLKETPEPKPSFKKCWTLDCSNFIKKQAPAHMFSCKFYEISQNSFLQYNCEWLYLKIENMNLLQIEIHHGSYLKFEQKFIIKVSHWVFEVATKKWAVTSS